MATLFTSALADAPGEQVRDTAGQMRVIAARVMQTVTEAGATGTEPVDLSVYLTDPRSDAAAVRRAASEILGPALRSVSEVPCRRIAGSEGPVAAAAVVHLNSPADGVALDRGPTQSGALPRSESVLVKRGRLVFVAGQVANAPGGRVRAAGDIARQTAAAYGNVADVLAAAGATQASVVRETVWTPDLARWLAEAGPARGAFYGEAFPAAVAVEIDALSAPEQLVEIEVVAMAG